MLVCPGPRSVSEDSPFLPLQKEFFQDDVFPDTAVSWEPVLSAKAWLQGANGQPWLLSLQPPDMSPGALRDWVWVGSRMRVGERDRRPRLKFCSCWHANSSGPWEGGVAVSISL